MCVSRHRRQRRRSVRRIGSDLPLLVGHPGLEPGANGLRTQPRENESPGISNDSEGDIASRVATKRPETTLFGHGVQRENGVVPMENVHAAAAALLRRVADGGEISMAVLREFAELVTRSELVEASRQVLEGPPEFAVRRELAPRRRRSHRPHAGRG